MGKLKLALIGAVAVIGSASDAQPSVPPNAAIHGSAPEGPTADGRWHWILVQPATYASTGFLTFNGDADVTVKRNGHFHADLKPVGDEAIEGLTLDGVIRSGRVEATEILLNTDSNPAKVHGILQKRRYLDKMMDETIILRGGQAGPAEYLGLARFVQRPPR